jgi:hypothetical protein
MVLEDLLAVEIVHATHRLALEYLARVAQASKECIEIFVCGERGNAYAGRSAELKLLMERLRTVESGTNGHAAAVQDLGQVVGVNEVAREGDEAGALIGISWAKDSSVGEHVGEFTDDAFDHERLVGMDLVAPKLVEQVAGGGERHRA